jgi:hypothetical protein
MKEHVVKGMIAPNAKRFKKRTLPPSRGHPPRFDGSRPIAATAPNVGAF